MLDLFFVLSVSHGKVDGNPYASLTLLSKDVSPKTDGKSGRFVVKMSVDNAVAQQIEHADVLPCLCTIDLDVIAGAGGKAGFFAKKVTPVQSTVGVFNRFLDTVFAGGVDPIKPAVEVGKK